MKQPDLFAPAAATPSSWRAWVPECNDEDGHGRGGYHTMVRLPDDPDESNVRGGAVARARIETAAALQKGDPWRFAGAIEALMHGDGRPRSLNAMGVLVVDKHGDIVAGSAFEECVWLLVKHKSLRWRTRPTGPPDDGFFAIEFAAWRLGDNIDDPPREGLTDHRWRFRAGRTGARAPMEQRCRPSR